VSEGSRTRLGALLAAAVLAVATLAGCTSTTPSTPTVAPTQPASFLSSVKTMASMGDSITAGVNACGKQAACGAASWATGSMAAVQSVAQRIGTLAGTAPSVYNVAKSGARAGELSDQVAAVVAQKPDLVTILIGGNDICRGSVGAMTTAEDFGASVSDTLDTLSSQLPQSHFFVVSVPNLVQLVSIGGSNPTVAALWQKSKTCAALLSNAGSSDKSDQQRRTQVGNRIDAYNQQLATVCAAHPRCGTDQDAVHGATFTAPDISTVDYFHPSAQGQSVLASTVWPQLTRFATQCSGTASGGTSSGGGSSGGPC
jgi:lysophospholipase L1-like esterase